MKNFLSGLALLLCGAFFVTDASATCPVNSWPSSGDGAYVEVSTTDTDNSGACVEDVTTTSGSASEDGAASGTQTHSVWHPPNTPTYTIVAKSEMRAKANSESMSAHSSIYQYDVSHAPGSNNNAAKAENTFTFSIAGASISNPVEIPYTECSYYTGEKADPTGATGMSGAASNSLSATYVGKGPHLSTLTFNNTTEKNEKACNHGVYVITDGNDHEAELSVNTSIVHGGSWSETDQGKSVSVRAGVFSVFSSLDVKSVGGSCTSSVGSAAGCEEPAIPEKDRDQAHKEFSADAGICAKPARKAGNPINFFYGYKNHDQIDYVNGILSFARNYRNYRSDRDWISGGPMGERWRHNFEGSITYTEDGSNKFADVIDSTGSIVMFYKEGAGDWTPYYDDVVSTLTGDSSSGFTYTTVDETKEIYNGSGQLTRIEYRGFEATNLDYNSTTDLLETVSNEHGQSLDFTYNADGTIDEVDTPSGTFTFAYDSDLNLTSVTKPDLEVITYNYADSNWPYALTSIVDERGETIGTYTYDASSGNALTTSSPITTGGTATNSTYTVSYDSATETKVTNPLGKETTYHFTTINGLRKLLEVEGHASTSGLCVDANKYYSYTPEGWLESTTDWEGNVTIYSYDSENRLNEIIEEDDATTELRDTDITYIASDSRLVNTITRGDLVIDYDYLTDDSGRLEAVTYEDTANSLSREHQFVYHNDTTVGGHTVLGKLKTYKDPLLNETEFTYDTDGFLETVTNELGHEWEVYARDTAGRITEILDPNGTKDKIEYDSMGRVTKYTQANNRSAPIKGATTYTYNEDGALYRINLPDGVFIKYFYDEAGRLEKINNDDDGEYYYFDAAGNVTETKRKKINGSSITYRYFQQFDELSRIIEHHNDQNSVGYEYDKNSNVVTLTDGNDKDATFAYDGLNRLISTQDRRGVESAVSTNGVTEFTYNELDDLLGVDFTATQDSASNAHLVTLDTDYTYNAFGEVETETSRDRGLTSYDYDSNGNLIERVDDEGREVNYAYDGINRLTGITYPNQTTLNVTLTYDTATGCGDGHEGRLCSVTGDFGTIAYVYDDVGRVTQVKKTPDSASFSLTTSYEYNASNYLVGITYPSGREVTYDYDNNGNVIEVTGEIDSTVTTLADNMVYMAFGPITSMDYGNGHSETNTYDDAYWLLTREVTDGTVVMDDTFVYDDNGNLKTYTDKDSNSENLSYTRNDELRKQANYSYELDGAGNRTRKYWLSQDIDIAYSYDDLGTGYHTSRIEQIYDTDASMTIANLDIDDAGMMEDYGGVLYNWDQAGRLTSLTESSATLATYDYDPQNQRFSKTIGSTAIYYVYAGGKLLGEYTGTGALIREYVYLNGRPLAQIDEDSNEVITYFHVDHQGTPRVGTDSTGASVWTWSYLGNAFGDIAPTSTGSLEVNLRMPGQYFDDETDLFYNWNRYYDPKTGRYVSSDPIGVAGGLNTFAYAGANPARYTDPEGLDAENPEWYETCNDGEYCGPAEWGAEVATNVIDGPRRTIASCGDSSGGALDQAGKCIFASVELCLMASSGGAASYLDDLLFGLGSRQGAKQADNLPQSTPKPNAVDEEFDFDPKVRERAVQDPRAHNFPSSFDNEVLKTTPSYGRDGYRIFTKEGYMNGKKGVFEMGVNKHNVIDHRFFRPYNK